jgi:UDP-glucuronate 4-epimerase
MKILVTGCAGFIGFHTAKNLLERGEAVVGFDVVNDYYDRRLKEARLAVLGRQAAASGGDYSFVRANLADPQAVQHSFAANGFDRVIHLAAQAGVRYSLEHPEAYVESNPFSEHAGVDHPLQFYAATKRANELMAHAYSHLFRLPTTGLRFFTVYGPWGRPDMALFVFTKNILEGKPINLFNFGNHVRDFTYIDDIVDGIIRASDEIAQPNPHWDSTRPDPATSNAPFRIFNLGANRPVELMKYVEALEDALGKKAIKEFLPLQAGDVPATVSDISMIHAAIGYTPAVPVREGIRRFVEWYRDYYPQ